MKNIIKIVIAVLLLFNLIELSRGNQLNKKIEHKYDLYLAHLEHCSFITNNEVEVGFDNYLRIKK